jgi:hypothetical protein
MTIILSLVIISWLLKRKYIMPNDKTKITKEMLEKAAKCQTSEELIALAKTAGIEITKAEAKAYLDELQDVELDNATLDKVAGGVSSTCWGLDSCTDRGPETLQSAK